MTNEATRTTKRLILASGSPRRRDLMREYGFIVKIIPPTLPEPDHLGDASTPAEKAEALSFFKARCVADTLDEGIVIGGDTIVAVGNTCYGKASDREDACRILTALGGTTQQVITGVTLIDAATGRRIIRHDVTRVTMRVFTPNEMKSYLESGEWEGKAGAYGIQDGGDRFITSFEGSFTNVVGMPMELVVKMLGEWGLARPRQPQP